MTQTSINIRTDEVLKRQFDELCEQLGLNLSTAINIVMKAAVRERRIPVSLSLKSIATRPRSLDDYTVEEFSASLEKGIADFEGGLCRPADDVFAELDKKYGL
ncbi:MAG: type II toxin-antitoxin system RelB/DinJ family antitoxin [Clostridiales bacterium]|jgi:addiction module RelB/DinJ family antitoxin|nr:type II toxin-antitoxin system RelB/DinJ family antitoxin [Clostridiales bacterium]